MQPLTLEEIGLYVIIQGGKSARRRVTFDYLYENTIDSKKIIKKTLLSLLHKKIINKKRVLDLKGRLIRIEYGEPEEYEEQNNYSNSTLLQTSN
jgi:hypothetical protein